MTAASTLDARGAPSARPGRRFSWAWLGVLPFLLFAFAFLVLPTLYLLRRQLPEPRGRANDPAHGAFTLDNYAALSTPNLAESYFASLEISAVTAIGGGIFGFLLAYAVIMGGLPPVPALGADDVLAASRRTSPASRSPWRSPSRSARPGILTPLLRRSGSTSTSTPRSASSWPTCTSSSRSWSSSSRPAIDGLRKDWREASENMGASAFQYWRYVALPILMPSLLGTVILLFGNAFGAQATAFELSGGAINIVTIQITRQIRGDALQNVGIGYALAMGMVAIMAVTIGAYAFLQRRAERWQR